MLKPASFPIIITLLRKSNQLLHICFAETKPISLSVQAYRSYYLRRKITTFSVKSDMFSKKVLLFFAILSVVADVENA